MPATETCSTSAGASRSRHRDLVSLLIDTAGSGRVRYVDWPDGQEAHRHRQLLFRLGASSRGRWGGPLGSAFAKDCAARSHFYRAVRPALSASPPVVIPFLQLTPGEDATAVRAAIDRVIAARLVRARAGTGRIRAGVRGCHRRRAARSASAPARMRWRSRCGRWGSEPGDEVITTPLSAAYSALAIMMAGARPVFADIDPERLTLDPRAAAAAVTSRTAAILPVHLYGQPADMPAPARGSGAAPPRRHRGLLPGAPGDVPGPARWQLRPCGRLQFLSDQESRRARRRRRSHHQRPGSRGAGAAPAQRRADGSLSSRRVRRELTSR